MSERAPLVRTVRLQPVPTSAGEARRFVRQVLAYAGESHAVDAAELAVSELVTNAILHAATPAELCIEVTSDTITVSVRDWHPRVPTRRQWGETATTGRGLSLVASVSDAFGVERRPPVGKSVWFRLLRGVTTPEHVVAWDVDALMNELETGTAVDLLLVGLPTTLWGAGQQQWEAVLRELYLYEQSHPDAFDADLVAAGRTLVRLSEAVGVEHGACADVHLSMPADQLDGVGALQDALDAGLRLGVDGLLLVKPALPEVVALRDWACDQLMAQAHGVPPTAWSGTDHPRFIEPSSAPVVPAPAWDADVVLASGRSVVAADDSNRLIAVSPAAAALLGWDAAELTGRRIVTIIPPSLREAHVAGFTRHLTTGETHVLGVQLELPVLRADGTEVTCSFLIERASAEAGRAVYLAWIEPLAH